MYHIKYRPLIFADVLGQDAAKRLLSRIAASGVLQDNAFLFPGPHGTGKTTLARIFARSLLCHAPAENGDPCNRCPSCLSHLADTHPCYLEVDAANNSGKDDIAAIIQRLSYETEGRRLVLLLDECHAISKAGKDALLKVLESHTDGSFVFLFCTSEVNKVPPALMSRSLPVPVRRLAVGEVASKITRICAAEGITITTQAVNDLAVACSGHLRDAETMLRVAAMSREDLTKPVDTDDVMRAGVAPYASISRAMQIMPRDPAESIRLLDHAESCAGPRAVYEALLLLLTEAARYGLSLEKDESVLKASKDLYRAFPRKIQPLLDYILTRQRIDDAALLRADLLVMYSRYLIGDIPDASQPQSATSTGGITGAAANAQESLLKDDKRPKSVDPLAVALAQREQKAQERKAAQGNRADGSHRLEQAHPAFAQERTSVAPFAIVRGGPQKPT